MNMVAQNQRGTAAAEARSERLDTDELMQLMRRNLWLMIVIALAVTGATAAYLSTRIPVYRTQGAMVLTNSEIRMSQIDTQLQSYELTRARVETELDVLRSRSFAEQVAKSIGLFDDPEFLVQTTGDSDEERVEHARAVIEKLLASYMLHRNGESLVITVQAEATTPDLAARIANGVVVSFIELSRTRQTSIIDSSTFHLENQIITMGSDLSQRQFELADFIRMNTLDDSGLPDRLRREAGHLASVLTVMESEGRGDTAEARRITADLAAIDTQLSQRTRNDLELGRMHRSVELLSSRYQTAVERLSDLERQRDLIQPDARQITVAELPMEPAWPNFELTLAMAFPAGLVLAFVLALLRSVVSQQVWDATQLARIGDLANLGMVPHIRRRGLLFRRPEPADVVRGSPGSAYSEAMRSLVTIWSSQPGPGSDARVLMIVSGFADEGRTTIAVSLAATAATDGMRVLLMDMDSHSQGASRSLGLTPAPVSFGELAEEIVPISAAVQTVADNDTLHLMAFLRATQLTPRVLHSFISRVLPQLRRSYDLIVIDTPPALAFADAVRLSGVADEALMVVRAGRTTMRTVGSTLEKLRTNGVTVAGTVVNDVRTGRYRRLNTGDHHG